MRKMIRKFVSWAFREEASSDDYGMAIPSPSSWASTSNRGHKSPGMYVSNTATSKSSLGDSEQGFHFTMYKASGGKVIQFNTYDNKVDKAFSSLYVIHNDDNVAEELSMILAKETLSR